MVAKKDFWKDVKMVVKMVRLSVAVLVFLLEYQMVELMEFSKVVKMVDLTVDELVDEMVVMKVVLLAVSSVEKMDFLQVV